MTRPTLLIAAAAASFTITGAGGVSQAQVAAPATAPAVAVAPSAVAAPQPGVAPAGTPIVIELGQPISTKVIHKGDMFAIRLAKPLMFEDKVLIPAGTAGMGQVVDAGRAGIGGKPAKLVLAARYLDFGGQHIALHGLRFGAVGEDHTTTSLLVSELPYVGILGFLVTGGEIEISEGALAVAKLTKDFPPAPADQAGSAIATQTAPVAAATAPVASATTSSPSAASPSSPKGL